MLNKTADDSFPYFLFFFFTTNISHLIFAFLQNVIPVFKSPEIKCVQEWILSLESAYLNQKPKFHLGIIKNYLIVLLLKFKLGFIFTIQTFKQRMKLIRIMGNLQFRHIPVL